MTSTSRSNTRANNSKGGGERRSGRQKEKGHKINYNNFAKFGIDDNNNDEGGGWKVVEHPRRSPTNKKKEGKPRGTTKKSGIATKKSVGVGPCPSTKKAAAAKAKLSTTAKSSKSKPTCPSPVVPNRTYAQSVNTTPPTPSQPSPSLLMTVDCHSLPDKVYGA